MNSLNKLSRIVSAVISLIILIVGFLSCKKQLQEETYSFISKESFYKTPNDAIAAVIAIYNNQSVGSYYDFNYYHVIEEINDQVTIHRNPTFIQLDNFNIPTDHPFVLDLWQAMFSTINRANTAISRIPGIEMNGTLKNSLLGEAHFLRANNYFNLVRLWGPVPLYTNEITSVESTNNPKGTLDAIYTQIISDLKFAEANLPVSRPASEFGRITKAAAQTCLAEVYLTRENWAEAAAKAAEVMAGGQHNLLNKFEDVFNVNNETNKEIIYSIQYDANLRSSSLPSFAHAGGLDNSQCFNGVQVWSVEEKSDMWLNWDKNEPRRNFTVYDAYPSKRGGRVSVYTTSRPFPAFGKYNAPNEPNTQQSPYNPLVYRYADVLLIFAEATGQSAGPTNAAYDAVNSIRRRAYNLPLNAPSAVDLSPGLSKQAFRDSVIRERSYEFALEGHRIYDLLRTNQFPAIIIAQGKTVRTGAKLLPIPQAELSSNKALKPTDQNAGY